MTARTVRSLSFLLLPVVLFFPYLTGSKLLGGPDFEQTYLPWQLFLIRQLREGNFPAWNPFAMFGLPVWGQVENSFLYPPRWILFFSPERTIAWFLLFHFVVAHWGSFRLGRKLGLGSLPSWLLGVVYTWNGWTASHLLANHCFILATVAWFPHLLTDLLSLPENPRFGRSLLLLFGELSFLTGAGSPQMAYYSLFAVSIAVASLQPTLFINRRFWIGLGLALGGAAFVALPHLWATHELHTLSHRSGIWPVEKVSWFAFSFRRIGEIFFGPPPGWLQRTEDSSLYETGSYAGAAAVLFAAWGLARRFRRSGPLLIAFVLFAALASAQPPFLLDWFRNLPSAALFRAPARFLAPAMLFLALLTAIGIDDVRGWLRTKLGDRPARIVDGALFVAIVLPLFLHMRLYVPQATDRFREIREQIALFARVETGDRSPRLLLGDGPIVPNAFWENEVEMTSGRSNLFLGRYLGYLTPRLSANVEDILSVAIRPPATPAGFIDAMAAPFELSTHLPKPVAANRIGPYFVVRNPRAVPKVRWFATGTAVVDEREAREMLATGHNPARELWYEGPPFPGTRTGSAGRCESERFSTDRWRLRCSSSGPGFVQIAQSYYPGWRARVNGVDAPIHPAQLLFQTVSIPAGKSEIDLTFVPTGLRPQLILVLETCSLFLTLALFLLPRRNG
ncbi:MAG: hypothetical protein V1495_04605 [Pseudomonadota bacterium]